MSVVRKAGFKKDSPETVPDVGGGGELSVQSLVSSVALILRRIVVTLDSGQWTLWGVKPNLIWGN